MPVCSSPLIHKKKTKDELKSCGKENKHNPGKMETEARAVLQRVIRKVPSKKLQTILRDWRRLSPEQLRSLDYKQSKWHFLENLISVCENADVSLKDVTNLEMIYYIENPTQGTWHAYQLRDADDDALSLDYSQFKQLFTVHLKEVTQKISIRMKNLDDGAVWIRIAWGDNFTIPNHLKPTYIVHYLQTPHLFILNLKPKHKPFLYQALVLATRYSSIKEAHLSASSLTGIRDLVMRQYQQVFPNQQRTLRERNALHPNINAEHAEHTDQKHQMACEAFGEGRLPKLETAVYKLETKYRGDSSNMDVDKIFRGTVTFSSSNILESLSDCVSKGIAETPISPLFSCITQKGRNHFVITDKVAAATDQKTS